MTERNIVVLGASYAGLNISHYILKHVLSKLPTDGKATYKLILVNPSEKFFVRHASPRAVSSVELLPLDKIFLDIAPGFEQYGEKVSFVVGRAVSWDPSQREVTIKTGDKSEQVLSYHALVLATGTKTHSPLFSSHGGSHVEIENASKTLHKQLSTAKSIIIAGGGPTAVETAAEIGEELNGVAGWFSSWPSNPKATVTIITNSERLLPALRPAIGQTAEKYLNRVGVKVQYRTKVVSTDEIGNGKTEVMLHDGQRLQADIYIPATGLIPMSEYVPAHLKDDRGFVINNETTLRVDAAGERVYAIGDIGTHNGTHKGIMDINFSVPFLASNLERDLLAAHANSNGKPTGPDRAYALNTKETQLVPIGRGKGVGAVFGWRLPSWAVWLIKGRDFMVGKSKDNMDGTSVAKESVWKQ